MKNHGEVQRQSFALKCSCLCGLAGAVALLVGDGLLYANFAPLAARRVIVLASPHALLASNLLCSLAAVLYVVGAWHVFARFQIASDRWSKIAGVLFALAAVMSCVYHALWSQFALIVQHANQEGASARAVFEGALGHMRQTLNATTFVAIPLIVLMLILVMGGRSSYPRWTAALNPFLLYGISAALLTPLANSMPTPFGALLLSSLSELTMAVFFAISFFTINAKAGLTSRLVTNRS